MNADQKIKKNTFLNFFGEHIIVLNSIINRSGKKIKKYNLKCLIYRTYYNYIVPKMTYDIIAKKTFHFLY